MKENHVGAPGQGFTCLLVDDDRGFLLMLERVIRAEGGEPVLCGSLAEARRELASGRFDIVLLDHGLPDGTGYEFHAEVARRAPESVVLMITGAPELAKAVALTRNGLFDYLTKPVDLGEFAASLRRALARRRHPDAPDDGGSMIGESPAMAEAVAVLRQAARHREAPVLLLGETGAGKDLAARLLHQWSYAGVSPLPPYVALNCGAVPAEMFEAELFGAEKGAYTGADRRREGLVEAAEGGTLFLDEVAEIPLAQQAKLLRFLESREYRALGTTRTRQFRGRIVAATHQTLAEAVREGRFRADLHYRLDVLSVRLPALRERIADLAPLAESLLRQLAGKYGRPCPYLRPPDLEALRHHTFPGNVRELRNLLERSLLRTADGERWLAMDLSWLPRSAAGAAVLASSGLPAPASGVAPATVAVAGPASDSVAGGQRAGAEGVVGQDSGLEPLPPGRELTPLERSEYCLIRGALRQERGGIRRAAARLGLTHQALLRRLQKWPELREYGDPMIGGQGEPMTR